MHVCAAAQGLWELSFSKDATSPAPFTLEGGAKVEVSCWWLILYLWDQGAALQGVGVGPGTQCRGGSSSNMYTCAATCLVTLQAAVIVLSLRHSPSMRNVTGVQ